MSLLTKISSANPSAIGNSQLQQRSQLILALLLPVTAVGSGHVLCWDVTGSKQEQEDDRVQKTSQNMQVLPNQNITGTVSKEPRA